MILLLHGSYSMITVHLKLIIQNMMETNICSFRAIILHDSFTNESKNRPSTILKFIIWQQRAHSLL